MVIIIFGALPGVFEHGVPLSPSPANPSPGYFEYLPIQEQYDQQRHVKRGTRSKYLIANVLTDHAPLLDVDTVQIVRVLPAKLRGQRNDKRHTPYNHNHSDYPPTVPCVNVIQIGHSPIPGNKSPHYFMSCRLVTRHVL